MATSMNMVNAIIEVNSRSEVDLILERDIKFEYDCSVKVTRGECLFLKQAPKNSYSKEVSVNDVINKLLDEIKYLKSRR